MYGQNESSSIPENVWKFAELVSPLGDTELFAIAAELLSLLGPLRPNTLAFITPEMKLPIDSKHIKVGLTEAGSFVFRCSQVLERPSLLADELDCSRGSDYHSIVTDGKKSGLRSWTGCLK